MFSGLWDILEVGTLVSGVSKFGSMTPAELHPFRPLAVAAQNCFLVHEHSCSLTGMPSRIHPQVLELIPSVASLKAGLQAESTVILVEASVVSLFPFML